MVTEEYEINGITRSFIDWCNAYNRRPLIIRARMSTGMSLEEALNLIDNKRDNIIFINKEYRTFQEWCKYYTISSSTVRVRIKRGWDLKSAFTLKIDPSRYFRKPKQYTVNGKSMGMAELSKKYNINQSTISSRLRRGESIYEALNIEKIERKKFTIHSGKFARYSIWEINGISKTLIEWCTEYGLSYDCIKERLSAGISIEKALTMDKTNVPRIYEYDNKLYNVNELSVILNIKINTLKNWLNQGLSIHAIKEKANGLTEYRTLPRPDMYKINGNKLKEIRSSKRISQRKLSVILGDMQCKLNRDAIGKIEAGKWLISSKELKAIATALQIEKASELS